MAWQPVPAESEDLPLQAKWVEPGSGPFS